MTMKTLELVNRCNERMLAIEHNARANRFSIYEKAIMAQTIVQIRLLRDEVRFMLTNS